YDVVPAQSREQFNPVVRNGRLYGRGSTDMKSGLAAMIYATYLLKELRVPLRGRIGLCLVADEETGGPGGGRALRPPRLAGPGRRGDAHTRTDQRRHLEREPGSHHPASHRQGQIGTRRPPAPGRQRLRADAARGRGTAGPEGGGRKAQNRLPHRARG